MSQAPLQQSTGKPFSLMTSNAESFPLLVYMTLQKENTQPMIKDLGTVTKL